MKRIFDIIFSIFLLVCFFLPIIFLIILATIDTKSIGLFWQTRIGRNKSKFLIFKIRTLNKKGLTSNFGKNLRRYKIDELPQLYNLLLGHMTFVGPRPEVPEFYKEHNKYPKELLSLKPGITGLASVYFINEDKLKEKHCGEEFEKWMYLRKITLNLIYLKNKSFLLDMFIVWKTFLRIFKSI